MLTTEQRELASSDPAKLTAYQRGEIRAMLMGADRVEVQRLIDGRPVGDDENDGAGPSAYQRGLARGLATSRPSAYTIGKVTGGVPDTKLN
jgi:hypothetical protein